MLGDNYTQDKKLCRVAYSNKKIGPRAIQAHPDLRRVYLAATLLFIRGSLGLGAGGTGGGDGRGGGTGRRGGGGAGGGFLKTSLGGWGGCNPPES